MRLARILTVAVLAAGLAAAANAQAPANQKQLAKELKKQLRQKQKAEEAKQAELAKKAAAAKKAEEAKKAAAVQPVALVREYRPAVPPALAALPAAKDPVALAALIDRHVDAKLAEDKVVTSPPSSDAEFLRRVYLDLTGVIPPADKAKEFLDSADPQKRARLIDELLADPNYGRHLTDAWVPKLFPRESANRFVLKEPLAEWFTERFNANGRWDKLVYDLVTATGAVEENGAVTYFLANRSVDKLTDTATQHFLGVQLQCAQCHNHPFTGWKQKEYWGVAAFFSRVQPQNPKNANKGGDNSKIGVRETPTRTKLKDFFPEATQDVPPKFLGGAELKAAGTDPLRPLLAAWMVSPDNPYFAKAMVNRTWARLTGRGFVEPIDDMHDDNPASHPELLAELSKAFAGSGFDLKHLTRGICLSRAYQRSSKPTAGNEKFEEHFAKSAVKVMTPEQLYDSITRVAGAAQAAAKAKGKDAAGQKRNAGGPRDQFVQFFLAGAEEADPTEYEAGIPQALKLMNGRFGGTAAAARGIVGAGAVRPADAIEKLYLAALSRRPTVAETDRLTRHVSQAATPTDAYSDILWAILNSSEFTMVR